MSSNRGVDKYIAVQSHYEYEHSNENEQSTIKCNHMEESH